MAPKLSETPWIPIEFDRATARTKWIGYSKIAKRSLPPQELSVHDVALYQIRFIFASDRRLSRPKLVGIGPHLARLSPVLHLAVAETVGAALACHRVVGAKIQENARNQTVETTEFVSIMASGNFTIEEQAKEGILLAIEADSKKKGPSNKGDKGKGKCIGAGKGGKGGNPPDRNSRDCAADRNHRDNTRGGDTRPDG